MDLRGIANGITSTVNKNVTARVLRSTGYTIGTGLKQVPTYADPIVGPANVQALDNDDLKQIDGLNLQGVIRAIYLRGALAGTVRPNQTGGDLVLLQDDKAVWRTWLVVKVLESWPTWSKAVIVLQDD